jgi:hypothetical protein
MRWRDSQAELQQRQNSHYPGGSLVTSLVEGLKPEPSSAPFMTDRSAVMVWVLRIPCVQRGPRLAPLQPGLYCTVSETDVVCCSPLAFPVIVTV